MKKLVSARGLVTLGVLLSLLGGCSGGGGSSGGSSGGGSSPASAQIAAGVIFSDPAAPQIATLSLTTGQQVTFVGTKDAQGFPTSITSLVVQDPSGDPLKTTTLTYDAQNRPVKAVLGSGVSIQFIYPATLPGIIDVQLFGADGTLLGTIHYDTAAKTATSTAATASIGAIASVGSLSRSPLSPSLLGVASSAAITSTPRSQPTAAVAMAMSSSLASPTTTTVVRSITGQVAMTCVGTPFDGASVGAMVDMQYYPSNQPGGGMPAVSWPLLPTPIAGPPVGLFSYTTSLLITSTSDPKLVQTVQNVSAWLETNVESKCAVLKDPAVAIASEVLIDVTAAKAFFIPVTGPILSAAILVVGNAILVTCQVSGKLTLSGNAVNKILDYMSKITETGNLTVSGRYQGFGTGNQAITLDSSNTMNGQGPPFTLDFPAGACTTVQFGTFAMSVGGTVEVPVTRTGPSSALHVPASVLVDPIQDSQSAATPGVDYTFAPSCGGGVCFNPGDITANLVIQILPNPDRKTSKNLTLQLSLPADQDAVRLGQPAQTTLVITGQTTLTATIGAGIHTGTDTQTGSCTVTPPPDPSSGIPPVTIFNTSGPYCVDHGGGGCSYGTRLQAQNVTYPPLIKIKDSGQWIAATTIDGYWTSSLSAGGILTTSEDYSIPCTGANSCGGLGNVIGTVEYFALETLDLNSGSYSVRSKVSYVWSSGNCPGSLLQEETETATLPITLQ